MAAPLTRNAKRVLSSSQRKQIEDALRTRRGMRALSDKQIGKTANVRQGIINEIRIALDLPKVIDIRTKAVHKLVLRKTPTGQWRFNTEQLVKLTGRHPGTIKRIREEFLRGEKRQPHTTVLFVQRVFGELAVTNQRIRLTKQEHALRQLETIARRTPRLSRIPQLLQLRFQNPTKPLSLENAAQQMGISTSDATRLQQAATNLLRAILQIESASHKTIKQLQQPL